MKDHVGKHHRMWTNEFSERQEFPAEKGTYIYLSTAAEQQKTGQNAYCFPFLTPPCYNLLSSPQQGLVALGLWTFSHRVGAKLNVPSTYYHPPALGVPRRSKEPSVTGAIDSQSPIISFLSESEECFTLPLSVLI